MVPDSPIDVAAVIPTLGREPDRLESCLESVLASRYDGRVGVTVVWNDPRLPAPSWDGVSVVTPGLNLGFPGALNHARSRTESEFLWVLQDDVRVTPDCLAALVHRLSSSPRLGVVSPVAVNAEGRVPARTRAGVLDENGGIARFLPESDSAPGDLDPHQHLDWVGSSGALVRVSAWDEVGGYDPEFFPLGASDIDLCVRLARSGYGIAWEPSARIQHEIRGTTPDLLFLYLADAHGRRIRHKHFGPGPPTEWEVDADPDLVSRVAASATLGFIDFARFASRERKANLEAIERLEAALLGVQSSASWRLTRPLRSIKAWRSWRPRRQ